jgi:hypothetical protein
LFDAACWRWRIRRRVFRAGRYPLALWKNLPAANSESLRAVTQGTERLARNHKTHFRFYFRCQSRSLVGAPGEYECAQQQPTALRRDGAWPTNPPAIKAACTIPKCIRSFGGGRPQPIPPRRFAGREEFAALRCQTRPTRDAPGRAARVSYIWFLLNRSPR